MPMPKFSPASSRGGARLALAPPTPWQASFPIRTPTSRRRNITLHHWRKLAAELHVDAEATTARVDGFAAQLADHVPDIRRRMNQEGIAHPLIARLADELMARAAAC